MNNKKMKIAAISTITGFASLGVVLGVGITFTIKPSIPHSQKMTNSIFVSNFIENIGNKDFISINDFDKSIKLFNGDEEITDYSHLTVNEAYVNNYFKFEIPSKVKFYADRNGIDVFMKSYNENTNDNNFDIYPSYYNSSSPEFKIWFGKGEGENRVEDFITIYGAGFHGFRKTQEEQDVKSVINLFRNSVSLKPKFYDPTNKTIRDGVFAKTIKTEDIVSSLNEKQLNGVNWNVTSVSQDPKIPSKLIINVDFSKGQINENYFSQTFQKFEIDGFPIEMGVDDYESKVKNFIKDEKNTIGLGEAFEYKRPESQPAETVGTVLENYKNNAFTFNIPFSFKNRASNAGVEYIFKPWVEGENENSAFPDEENSEIPKFKIFVRSGSGTPFEYEDFFIVRGNGQVTNVPFDKTPNNDSIDKLKELANSGSNDPFTDITVILTLIKEFASFNNNRQGITSKIIAGVDKPLDNIKLSLGDKISSLLPPEIPKELIKVEAKEITSENNKLSIKVEISLGKEFEDKSSFVKKIKYDGFKTEGDYDRDLVRRFLDAIELDNSSVVIKNKIPISIDNVEALKYNIKNGNGSFYFFDNVFVGYDSIMQDFKWSSKPTFKIDFSETKIEGESIKFRIMITAGIETQRIFLTRTIASFYNSKP